MAKAIKITDDGLKKLKEELEYLKTEGRADIAEKIKVARGYGDLSENSEYDEAKNEQAKIEARIVEIEAMLKNVEIIKDINKDGTTILLVEQNAGKSLAISDRAYVLETGSIVLSGTGAELAASDEVKKAYLGG